MPNTRSFLGHLEALRLTLESTREYIRTNAETFMQTASAGTMTKADRTITKIQGHLATLDSELNAVAYEISGRLRPD